MNLKNLGQAVCLALLVPASAAAGSLPPLGVLREQAKLTGVGDAVGDRDGFFGTAVAADADTVIVGAPGNGSATQIEGVAYVFVRAAGVWTDGLPAPPVSTLNYGAGQTRGNNAIVTLDGAWRQQSRLEWYGLEDAFAASVALSGNYLAVGAPTFYITQGFVDVFVRGYSRWSRTPQRIDTDLEADPYVSFGAAVAFSGRTLLVRAPGAGVIVLFRREERRWVEAGRLTPHDQVDFDQFGRALAVSGDTLIVGAPAPWVPSSVGGAYVFVGGGASWMEQQKLVDPDPHPRRQLGLAVAVRGDAAFVATGRWIRDTRGSVLSFERTGTVWGLLQRIEASAATRYDDFGAALALGPDIAVVGAPGAAAAYVLGRVPPRSTR